MSHQVAICQPHYIPWIGYFEMLDRVDEFVFLDDVDIIMREWKTRNRIRKQRSSDDTKWLTVPIERSCRRATPLNEARIGGEGDWHEKHANAFREVYAHTPHFADADRLLRQGSIATATTLADLNVGMVQEICTYLGITTPLRRASQKPTIGRKTDKLVGLCIAHGGTSYLANNGSAAYLDASTFEAENITVAYQDYVHPEYTQSDGKADLPFLSHLSVLDLIANHGPDSLNILRQGRPACAT